MSSMHTTCPAHVIFLDFIIPKIFVRRPNYVVLHCVAFITLLALLPIYSHTLFSTYFINALNLHFFLNVKQSFTLYTYYRTNMNTAQ